MGVFNNCGRGKGRGSVEKGQTICKISIFVSRVGGVENWVKVGPHSC